MKDKMQFLLALAAAAFAAIGAGAAQLPAQGWKIQDLAGGRLDKLTDGDPLTLVTLKGGELEPAGLTVDLGESCAIHRVFLSGKEHRLELWDWQKNKDEKPLGQIVLSVGDTAESCRKAAEFMVPYDGGQPIDIEADMRFSPLEGRYLRIELQNAPDGVEWNVGELEVYGFKGPDAKAKKDAVVLQKDAAAPLALAAGELSYYLGELSGRPHPIITPDHAGEYPGTLYHIVDLKPLAPSYEAMEENIAEGKLPDGINIEKEGPNVFFKAWPYRCVLWSVWEFLERQGVRWLYPDAHGDFVPTGKGVDLAILPLKYSPSAWNIYANWNADCFQPWPPWDKKQTLRQSYLYPWRNRWTYTWGGRSGPLGGEEIPKPVASDFKLNEDYKEGFAGFPHNFDTVLPRRIRDQHPDWNGYSKKEGKRIPCNKYDDPTFCMSNPELIEWVADKMVEASKASPLPKRPLAMASWQMAYNLLPMDACRFCECERCLEINGPRIESRAPYVYERSMSGVYYYFISEVAKLVKERAPGAIVGALAYCNVNYPPENIRSLPENTYVDLCVYGEGNLPMDAKVNADELRNWETWSRKCGRFSTYDYILLHTGHYQKDSRLPVPLVTAIVDRAKHLNMLGMLNGGCEATPGSLPYNPWNFYAYPRIRWNIGQTAEQILDDFFNGYYRESAGPMLAYYMTLEDHLIKNEISLGQTEYYRIVPGAFPPNILSAMKKHLDQAAASAKSWVTKHRVALARESFDWILEKRNLKGVDLDDVSIYPKTAAANNGILQVDISKMWRPDRGARGNFTEFKNGEWHFEAQGEIQTPLLFEKPGKYKVTVTARSVPHGELWPILNLWIGRSKASSLPADSAENKDFIFDMDVPAGVWDLVLTFENSAEGGKRNLIVKGIRVEQAIDGGEK